MLRCTLNTRQATSKASAMANMHIKDPIIMPALLSSAESADVRRMPATKPRETRHNTAERLSCSKFTKARGRSSHARASRKSVGVSSAPQAQTSDAAVKAATTAKAHTERTKAKTRGTNGNARHAIETTDTCSPYERSDRAMPIPTMMPAAASATRERMPVTCKTHSSTSLTIMHAAPAAVTAGTNLRQRLKMTGPTMSKRPSTVMLGMV